MILWEEMDLDYMTSFEVKAVLGISTIIFFFETVTISDLFLWLT